MAVLSVLLVGCRSTPKPDLEVVATWWEPLGNGMRQASGRLHSNRSASFDTVMVLVDLYDANGRRMYSRADTILNVQPHETRSFTTWVLPDHPATFRIARVTAVGQVSSSTLPSIGRAIRGGRKRTESGS